MLNKSFTGSNKNYVVLQARLSDDYFHIQGKGKEVNRNYGVAEDISAENFGADIDWTDSLDHINSSLAGTDRKYFRFQAKIAGTNLHIQIPGPELNRNYGLSMNIPVEVLPNVAQFVKAELGN